MNVFIALIDDDGEIDAQPFRTRDEACEYCAGLVLLYLRENPDEDVVGQVFGQESSWTARIDAGRTPADRYNEATTYLNGCGVEDLGVMILQRHVGEGS